MSSDFDFFVCDGSVKLQEQFYFKSCFILFFTSTTLVNYFCFQEFFFFQNESVSELNQAKENSNFEATRPRDLFAIRFAVHNQRYHSIGQFCSDVKNVIQSIIDETERLELEKIFKEESGKVFSWFNFETGKVKDNINEAE